MFCTARHQNRYVIFRVCQATLFITNALLANRLLPFIEYAVMQGYNSYH